MNWNLGHLDALRGIAVLGVILVHAAGALPPTLWTHFALTGQRGVQLFFMVSAFTLFLSNDHRSTAERRPTLNFFIRRFFRIAPMYYLAIAIALTPLAIVFAGRRRDLLLAVLFLHGLNPHAIAAGAAGGWSIADEALFYAILPFLFKTIRSLRSALQVLLISTPLIYLFSRALIPLNPILPPWREYLTFFWFPTEFPVFVMGIAIYLLWKQHLQKISSSLARELSIALLALAFAIFLDLPATDTNDALYLSSAMCALFVIALSLHAWPLFVNRFTIFLGKISFSVYLLHFYILFPSSHLLLASISRHPFLQHHPGIPIVLLFSVSLAAIIPIAAATWWLVEEPGRLMGKRIIARLEGRGPIAERRPDITRLGNVTDTPDAQF